MIKNKKIILISIFILIILILVVIYFLFFQQNTDGCLSRCLESGYKSGECLRSGSGTGSVCENMKGTNIFDKDKPIPGCDFKAIGSWDECCCSR